MKRRVACAALPGLALALAAPAPAWPTPLAAGAAVRWPEVALLDGGRFGPREAEGRAVVAVFWSVTCPFCRRHNERLQKLHEAAAGKPLAVLGIARESDPALVREHLRRHGLAFPVTLEHAPLSALLAPRRLVPLTVTIDRQGRLRQHIPGEMAEDDVMELMKLAA